MPTVLTHALAGLGVGAALTPTPQPWSYYVACLGLGVLPDLDAVGFSLGVHYGSRWGHRGMTHSLLFASAAAVLTAAVGAVLGGPFLSMLPGFFGAAVSHTLLDAVTDGGHGVALFAPLSDRRIFLPWRPIRVSPIGMAAFSPRGLRALASEVMWVWLPLAVVAVVALAWQSPAGGCSPSGSP